MNNVMNIVTVISNNYQFPLFESASLYNFSIYKIKAMKGSSSYHAKVEKMYNYVCSKDDDDVIIFADIILLLRNWKTY